MTEDTNKLIAQRREKLAVLRENGNAFPNTFRRDAMASEITAKYSSVSDEQLKSDPVRVKVAGRMMTRRIMGKNSFVHIQDMSGQIQLFAFQTLGYWRYHRRRRCGISH